MALDEDARLLDEVVAFCSGGEETTDGALEGTGEKEAARVCSWCDR